MDRRLALAVDDNKVDAVEALLKAGASANACGGVSVCY